MAHPRRRPFVDELLTRLDGEVEVVWDEHESEWDTGRRALLAYDEGASHHLVIQDDAIVCPDLLAGVDRAAAAAGGRPLGLFISRVKPQTRVGLELQRLEDEGQTFLGMDGPMWGVAVAIPTEQIPDLVAWSDEHSQFRDYDLRMTMFYRAQRIECWYTLPSLVDHRPESESPSLLDGHNGDRPAHRFIGERSALEIEWRDRAAHLVLV